MNYEYDIAISYKSEIEEKASKINDFLIEDGWNVFFAPARQQELLSEKIHQMLYGIYKNRSLMKVLLISDSYLSGDWTSLEKRVSLQSTETDRKRLLIINYTNQLVLPGELRTMQYLDGRKYTEDQIAAFITERIRKFALKNVQGSSRSDGKEDVDKYFENKLGNTVIYNHNTYHSEGASIVTGDHASFGDIHF